LLFTPVVGGILAGLNQQRLGCLQRARTAYRLSFYSFVVFLVLAGYIMLVFVSTGAPLYRVPTFLFAVGLMTPVYLGDRSEPKEIKYLRVTVFSESH